MKHLDGISGITMRRQLLTCLLMILVMLLAGCSTLPSKSSTDESLAEGNRLCAADPQAIPPQTAADDCRKEVCRDGRLERIENLSETAVVDDWAEEGFCLLHPLDCLSALSVKDHVRQWEQDKARAGLWDRASLKSGLGDAARHAYLACSLTRRFGSPFAKGLLDAHEEDSSVMFGFGTGSGGNRCCDKLMDLHNNRIGIELAAKPGDCEHNVLDSLSRLRHSLCAR